MFKEINYKELKINPMTMFGDDWALAGAGTKESGYNAMTIAWGHLGVIWDRPTEKGKMIIPTAEVYLRPQRYTKEFFDREEYFTISTFSKEYKKALGYMGFHSGRDEDKIAEAGLTPMFLENTFAFEEAELILVCKKIYHAPIVESGFVEKQIIADNYPAKDFHEMYVGEITKVMIRDEILDQ